MQRSLPLTHTHTHNEWFTADDLLFKHTHLGHVVGVLQVWALWDINRTQMQHNRSPVCLSVLSCITPLLVFSCVSHSILSVILSSPGSTLSVFLCLSHPSLLICLTPLLLVLFSSSLSPSCLSLTVFVYQIPNKTSVLMSYECLKKC